MGDTASGSWTSRELGQHVAKERDAASRVERHRELVYNHLLRRFEGFAHSVGGWESENGVNLDGMLWTLAQQIAEGDFALVEKGGG